MFTVFSDPMGKEHHVRRTSGVPPLMVVVSVFLCLIMSLHAAFPRSIIGCIKNNDPSPFFSWSLISFFTLKSSFSVCRAAKFIYSKDNNRISVIVSMPLLLVCLTLCVCCSVFWDLYCAAPERRDTCEHSSEAKAFHDYVSLRWFSFLCSYWLAGTDGYYLESLLGDAASHFVLNDSNR